MAGRRGDSSFGQRYGVLQYGDGRHEVVPAGDGARVVAAHRAEIRRRQRLATLTVAVVGLVLGAVGTGWLVGGLGHSLAVGRLLGGGGGAVRYRTWEVPATLPTVVPANVSATVVHEYVDDVDPGVVTSPIAS